MANAFPLDSAFDYRHGQLHIENVALTNIAAEIGTPVYVYSKAALMDNYQQFSNAFKGMRAHICYALKALPNIHVVKLFASLGAGADVVSIGEMQRAMAAGIPPQKIAFPGVAKTCAEIDFALRQDVMQFNVESESELHMIANVAQSLQKTAHVVFRVNPDVDAKTHQKITTGKKENKFGIDIDTVDDLFRQAKTMKYIKVLGIGAHIGSQILDLQPFADSYALLRDKILQLRKAGYAVTHVDLGGGLGVPYHAGQIAPSLPEYAKLVRDLFGKLDIDMVFEPGRCITANAGILLTTAHHIKRGRDRHFVLTDGGMNDLLRPTLYEAHHEILPIRPSSAAKKVLCDVVGPVCESSDYLAQERVMPLPQAGDLLAVASAGAYGASMASEYNSRPLVPEVLVDGNTFTVIRRRPSYKEMWRLELGDTA